MAKLHSWVRSNSSRCGGDITLSTRSRACCGVSGLWVIGEILPWTFIDGGMPAVMNRSDAFWCAISLRKLVKSMLLMTLLRDRGPGTGDRGRHVLSVPNPSSARVPPDHHTNSDVLALHRSPVPGARSPRSLEQPLVLRVILRLRARDQAALDQVLQVLVEGHHAVL